MNKRRRLLRKSGIDYSKQYLTIVSLANNNTITWKCSSSSSSVTKYISISTDEGTNWTTKLSNSSGMTLATLNNGDRLLIKYYNTDVYSKNSYNYFTSTQDFDVEGNIMSLTTSNNFENATSVNSDAFRYLFYNCQKLKNANNLVLPATTLGIRCYLSMFQGCTSLTTAPQLPATTLANACYSYMFSGCTSLTTAPALPATTLADHCYNAMFYNCTNLTNVPALPATTLAEYCYTTMFGMCKSLTTAPELPATTLITGCYLSMFQSCTSLTTAPQLPATTLAATCYLGMFQGCTSLTTAPELPAATLVTNCYSTMFTYSNKLNKITCYATNSMENSSYTNSWVSGVASSGTFICVSKNLWTINANGIPYGWNTESVYDNKYFTIISRANNNTIGFKAYESTTGLKTISISVDNGNTWREYTSSTNGTALVTLNNGDKIMVKGSNSSYMNNYFTSTQDFDVEGNIMSLLYGDNFATQTSLTNSYSFLRLFYNCSKLKNAALLILPATTLANYCYDSMFYDCTSLTIAPQLPATTLADHCYNAMFYNCTNLTNVPALPAKTLANYCYNSMFGNCISLTKVPSNLLPATTLTYYCYGGMFGRCTSLTTAPALPATTLASHCYNNMFSGCTSLTTAPILSATNVPDWSYAWMFEGCSKLNYVYCLASGSNKSMVNWLNGVASTGYFYKPSSTSWVSGASGIPSGWTVYNV